MNGLLYRLKYSANALLCVQLVPPYTGGSCRLEHSPANGAQGRGRGARALCGASAGCCRKQSYTEFKTADLGSVWLMVS